MAGDMPPPIMNLTAVLQSLIDCDHEAELVDAVQKALARRATAWVGPRKRDKVEAYLENAKIRGRLRRAVSFDERRVRNVASLAHILTVLGVPCDELFVREHRYPPWDHWRPGGTAVVVFGERSVTIPQVAQNVSQFVVGARDLHAYGALCDLMYNRLRLDCRLRICLHPARNSLRAARNYLHELREDTSLAAIVVVGSPIVNPLAVPLAEAFLEGTRFDRLPARFAWHGAKEDGSPHPHHPVLSEPVRVEKKEEGIWCLDGRILHRVHDDLIRESLDQQNRGPFSDCGMMLIRYDFAPMLILCAGHGGCGTWAAMLALGETSELAVRHQESIEPSVSRLRRRDRIFALVKVDRFKPHRSSRATPVGVDDLEFDPEYGKGWQFYLEQGKG